MLSQEQKEFELLQVELETKRQDQNLPILLARPVEFTSNKVVKQCSVIVYNSLITDPDDLSLLTYMILIYEFNHRSKQQSQIRGRGQTQFRSGRRGIQLNLDISRQQQNIQNPQQQQSDTPPSPLIGFKGRVWQQHSLNILIYVLRFISLITKANFATSFKLIRRNVFSLIGDLSSDFDYYKYKNFFKYDRPSRINIKLYWAHMKLIVPFTNTNFFKSVIRNFHLHAYLLRPEQSIMVIWNLYIITALTVSIFYTTLRLSFPLNSVRHDYTFQDLVYDQIPNCSFAIEILLKYNTCYYEYGILIRDRIKIAKNYYHTKLLLDFIVVAAYFSTFFIQFVYLDLLVILKVLQVTKLSDSLFSRIELTRNQTATLDLIKLVYKFFLFRYMIMLVAHLNACLWHIIGTLGPLDGINWITFQHIQNEDWVVRYFYSIYWSIITMTTIGYGDITPQSLIEKKFVTLITVLSCGMFAYSINSIGNIFGEMLKKSNQFRTDMNSLKKFLRTKGINKELQEKVRKYFEYIWSDDNEQNEEVFKFQEYIPKQLQEEMIVDVNHQILVKIKFFKENFSENFLMSLCKHFKSRSVAPEEIIYSTNAHSENFYVLNQGEIQVYVTLNNKLRSTKILDVIKNDAAVFGLLDFFQDKVHQSSAKSTRASTILFISKIQFLEAIKAFPNDFQRFCEMRDLVQFSNKLDEIGIVCKACNKSNHVVNHCPMIMGTPNRAKVLYNYTKYVPSDRRGHFRNNDKRRICSLAEQANLQESVINFLLSSDEYNHHLPEIKEQIQENLKSQNLMIPILEKIITPKDCVSQQQISESSQQLIITNQNPWLRNSQKRNTQKQNNKFSFEKSKSSSNNHVNAKSLMRLQEHISTKIETQFQLALPKIKEESVDNRRLSVSNDKNDDQPYLKAFHSIIDGKVVPGLHLSPQRILQDPHVSPIGQVLETSVVLPPYQELFLLPNPNSVNPSVTSFGFRLIEHKQTDLFANLNHKPIISDGIQNKASFCIQNKASFCFSVQEEDQQEKKQTLTDIQVEDEIFKDFDKLQDYDHYFFHNNINYILKTNQKFQIAVKKMIRFKRQETLLSLLNQKRSRINQQKTFF